MSEIDTQEEINPNNESLNNNSSGDNNDINNNPIIQEEINTNNEPNNEPNNDTTNNNIIDNPITQEDNSITQPEENQTINIPVSKENLNKSAVAVNANILANLVLYQSILQKIKEESDETEKSDIESKINIVDNLIQTSKELLQLVQITLNIPEDQQLDEDTIISKSKGDIDGKFKMFNVAESLGFLGLGLALLGGKKKHKKTRRTNKSSKGKKRNTKTNK